MKENLKEVEKINDCIQDLVYEKIQLKKAYNYYHATRDAEQFRHIEDNYGVGTPTALTFTPLIKKHIDVLVGEYLELDPELKISCKDSKTVSNIMRDKKLKIDTELSTYLRKHLQNMMVNVFINNKETSYDPFIENELKKIQKDIDKSFVSEYEIAAQNILTYVRQSRDIDLKNKMRDLFTDLLITGCCFYRVVPNSDGTNFTVEICNPLHTFIDKNYNEYYLNKSFRAVRRYFLNKQQVLFRYGKKLSNDAIKKLDDQFGKGERNFNTVYVRVPRTLDADSEGNITTRNIPSPGILGGLEVTPVFPWNTTGMYNYLGKPIVTVFEVEWLEYDKKNDRMVRHEGIKIGEDIYITEGESENVVRSQSNPKECTLSVNGLFFQDKNGNPFSIVLSTNDLQDKYDLLTFYRDNLIATSGTIGDWIDLAHIPKVLGVSLPERVEKWLAYKKNGVALFDSSQEGAEMLNTTFNGYDDTIKAQSIQAIQIAIESIELQAAAITGVFPEKLGQIQERDAVSNVKVGLKYSTLLTKQYFSAMDLMFKEINYDMLNIAKLVYKKGITGSIVLGNKYNQIFTALPKHYTVTDFDVHAQDSSETFQDREKIEGLTTELIKAGYADPEMLVNIVLTKSMTELKQYVEESMAAKREENNQLQQMQQQLEQYENELKQMQQQLQQQEQENKQLQSRIERNDENQVALDRKRVALEEEELELKREDSERTFEIRQQQLQVEIAQFYDQSPYNDKVKKVI